MAPGASYVAVESPNSATLYAPGQLSTMSNVPLFLGYIQSFLFQGVLIVQVFIYYLSFPMDPRSVKALVCVVFFVECLSSFFAAFAAINSLMISESADLLDVGSLWAIIALAPLCGLAVLLVHGFYAWRIWILGKSWIVPAVIALLTVAQFAMVTMSGFMDLGVGMSTIFHPKYLAVNIVWLGGSVVCDVIITTTLVILFRRNSDSRISETNSILMKLIALTVENGMITGFGAGMELLFFLIFRNTFIHLILFYTLPKLYANCMMATLNARLVLPWGYADTSFDVINPEGTTYTVPNTSNIRSTSYLTDSTKPDRTKSGSVTEEQKRGRGRVPQLSAITEKPLPRPPRRASRRA